MNLYFSSTKLLGSIYFNTNKLQVAPVLKSWFEKSGIGTQYLMFAIHKQSPVLIFRHYKVLTTQGHDKCSL